MSAGGLDLQSRILLNRIHLQNDLQKNARRLPGIVPQTKNSLLAFVDIQKGYSAADLEDAGMKVLTQRGGIAIVSVPTVSVEAAANMPCVKKLSIERPMSSQMKTTRETLGIDNIHSGKAFDVPYTGKGVLAAAVDEGIDPNHPSFKDAEGGNRIKYLSYYDGSYNSYGYPYADYYGDDMIGYDEDDNIISLPGVDKFITDKNYTYHGTHTLNALGGSYRGDVTLGFDPATGQSGTTVVSNPYYGVAPDAELAISCGELSDACIAFGIDGFLSYADYRYQKDGIPSVLNLSIGNTWGAHDPQGLMNRFLEECGRETIIVVASGNQGDMKLALKKSFTPEDNSVASLIYPYGFRYDTSAGSPSDDNTYFRTGAVMVYSKDDTPFTLRAFIMTGTEGNYRRRATMDITSEEGAYYLSDEYYANYVGGNVNTTVARYFDGYIGGGSMYDEGLGRYYGVVDYYLMTLPETGINEDGSEGVIVGFEVVGQNGQVIECYCDGDNTWMSDYGLDGYTDGSRDGTISDMAVGENILVVGAYTLDHEWYSLDGNTYGYLESDGFKNNDIGTYTSFGTLENGRTVPDVCAPGTAIISAVSNPYVEATYGGNMAGAIPSTFQAKTTYNGKDYYWKSETGTSMSTPIVTGAIALWLEADPTLTLDDVKDIIKKTSIRDEYVEAGIPAQWGAGKFDPVAGLKEVINRAGGAGVEGIVTDGRNDRVILTKSAPGIYDIFIGEANNLQVNVYSLSGACVFSNTFSGNSASIDLSALSSGVYIVKANNHSIKISL